MAINPSTVYPGQISTADLVGYPYGKAQNSASLGDGIGMPLEQTWVNDLLGFQQALLAAATLTPTGTPDKVGASQYLAAVNSVAATVANASIASLALKTWAAFAIPQVGTDIYTSIVGMRLTRSYGTLSPSDNPREVIVVGGDVAGSSKVRLAHTADGTLCETTPARLDSISGFTGATWAIAGAPNELGLINDGVQFAWSTDGTSTWNVSSGFSGPPSVIGLHYDAALGYFALGNNNNTCYRGTSFANLSGSPTTSLISTPGASAFVAGEVDMASNGTALVIAATTAAGVAQIYFSSNAGASFTTALTFNTSARHCNVTYSEVRGLFVAWCDTGEMFTSPDGSTWTAATVTRTPANGFQVGRGTLVTVGYAIAKPTKISTPYGDKGGIVYSFDLGATWNYSYFADLLNLGTKIQGLRAANGRIYATALGKLYRSGVLVAPRAEI